MVRSDPALMRPNRTVFRVGVMDGDRIVLPPVDDDGQPPNEGGGVTAVDADVWVEHGPPPPTPPAGMEPRDAWVDVASGDVYVLEPE